MGALPPVFIEFLGRATGFQATARGVKTELATVEAEGAGNLRRLGGVSKAALLGIGVAAGVAAVHTAHMAADFQTQMTRVQTSAGESAKNIGYVGNAVLKMAGEVGQPTKDLTSGLYMVESAGFHASDAINVLRTSAEGAKVGNADLATVADAVTTALNAYKKGAADVVPTMNALVATEAEGKTNMEALAGSMSGILPVASAAHVKLNEVLGAMATMTSQGTDARVAATYLRQTIGQLSNPSAKAAATMKGLGLNANSVSKELGSKGLAATLTTLTDAIKSKMGPGGDVLIKTLQKASKSGTDFQAALEKTSGSKKTYIGALATMVGGTKSMMGALQLTGDHMDTFKKNVDGIGQHVKDGGNKVEGWSDVQKTFNQRMAEFKGSAEGIGISIGQKLLPAFTSFVGWLSKGLLFLQSHSTYLKVFGLLLAGVTLGLAAASIASWSFTDSLLANPITWIVAGIVALIAGLALLITHWKQVWGWIETNIPFVAHFFRATWNMALAAFHQVWSWAVKAVQVTVRWFNANVLTWLRARVKDFVGWWSDHSAEIKQVWSALWKAIKLLAKTDFDWLGTAFTIFWGVVKTAWGLIVDATKFAWVVISGAVTGGMHLVLNTIGVVLDIVTGHWGRAWSDCKKLVSQAFSDIKSLLLRAGSAFGNLLYDAGVNLVKGLTSGIKSMVGSVASTAANLGKTALNAAKSALHINSPSRVFRDQVGKSIPEGMAAGITMHAGVAHAAVIATANGLVTSFKSTLGINSPSKVFRSLGIWIHTGLADGLTGSLSKVKSAIKKTETLLMQAMNRVKDLKGTKGVSNHWVASHEKAIKGLESYVKKEGAQLTKLANQRAAIASKLKKAQASLANLQKEWTSERDSIASGIMQGASVVMQTQADGAALTSGDVLGNMQSQVQAATTFAAELKELAKRGLSPALIEQIASAGVEQGGATAQALLSATSGQITQLNGMQKQLTTAANSTGSVVATSMYGTGIDAAKGLIKGLQSQEKAIDKQMLKIAKSMERAIKKALGIKSPSRLFHEIGQFIAAGLVGGIDSGNSDVRNAAQGLASAAIQGGTDAPTLSGTASSMGGAAVVHQVHITVQGSVLTDTKLRDVVQTEMYRFGGRNSRTWNEFKR